MDLTDFELLQFDSPVSDTDKARISAALAEAVLELDRLDAQIKELTRKRSALETTVENFRATLAPIRKLPRDLLEEIFTWGIPSKRNAVMSPREAPLSLGRVCSYWRRVSRSTPKLWSTLHIVIPDIGHTRHFDAATHDQLVALHAATDEWLKRAGAIPLSISIYCYHSDSEGLSEENLPLAHDILSLVLGFSRQWKRVRFDIPDALLPPLDSYSPDDFPRLAHMHVDRPFPAEELRKLLICAAKAPAIQSIHFPQGFHEFHSIESIELSFIQLTNLSMTVSWDLPLGPLDLLAFTSRLEKLSLGVITSSGWSPEPVNNPFQGRKPISLPLLRDFAFRDETYDLSYSSELCSLLHLPAVQNLTYHTLYNRGNVFPVASLPGGIDSLHTLRTTLHVGMMSLLIDYLRNNPQLKRLDLTKFLSEEVAVEYENALTSSESSSFPEILSANSDSPLCPNIEVLYLNGTFTLIGPLLDCIRSRMGSSPLRRVDLTLYNSIDDVDANELEEFRVECQSKGVKMTFRAHKDWRIETTVRDGMYERREEFGSHWDYGHAEEDEEAEPEFE